MDQASDSEGDECCLARPRVADNGNEFAFLDAEIDIMQHFGAAAVQAVSLADVF